MTTVPVESRFFPWILLFLSLAAAILSVGLAASAPEYDLFHVPFASWYIFLLNGSFLILAGSVFYWWRRFCQQQTGADSVHMSLLTYNEAWETLRRDEVRLGLTLDTAQRDRLIECTGGHADLLKSAAELLKHGQLDSSETAEKIARQLVDAEGVKSLCRELWNGFAEAEQKVLSKVARGEPLDKSAENEITSLKQKGILVGKSDAMTSPSACMFCPLFKLFVRTLRITPLPPNQALIETPAGVEMVKLQPMVYKLFEALVDKGDQVVRNDDLISSIYGDHGIDLTDNALSQLVQRLRATLDHRVQKGTGDPTYTCVKTERGIGYRSQLVRAVE